MNKLNKKCKYFAEQFSITEKIRIHSECVIEDCMAAKKKDMNKDIFIIAGWLHDLGRRDDKKKHHILGLGYLMEFLLRNPKYLEISTELADCILNHRKDGKPKTKYGKIFRKADKTSLLNPKWLSYKASVGQNN